jgi:hypothetical protein
MQSFQIGFIGPCPHRDRDYSIGSNFWKFYLNRTSFTLGEPVSLVKVFRLFRLEQIVLVFRVRTQYADVQHIIYWQGQPVCDALFTEHLMTHWKHYLTFVPIGCIKCDIRINSSTCNFCLFNLSLFYVGSVAHFT